MPGNLPHFPLPEVQEFTEPRPSRAFDLAATRRENAAVDSMGPITGCALTICRERIRNVSCRQDGVYCVLTNRIEIRWPLVLASHVAIGDEIVFSIPDGNALGSEVYLSKRSISGTPDRLYLATIGYATQPQKDKRSRSFLSVQVQQGSLGISWIFLPCDTVREYFYGIADARNRSDSETLYKTLRMERGASPAEIRIAFKLRSMELKTL